MEMYMRSLMQADSINQSFDSIEEETGNNSWHDAGRGV
jgi:hypothetical protein